MPQLVQDVMLLAPTTHFVSMAQAIFVPGCGPERGVAAVSTSHVCHWLHRIRAVAGALSQDHFADGLTHHLPRPPALFTQLENRIGQDFQPLKLTQATTDLQLELGRLLLQSTEASWSCCSAVLSATWAKPRPPWTACSAPPAAAPRFIGRLLDRPGPAAMGPAPGRSVSRKTRPALPQVYSKP